MPESTLRLEIILFRDRIQKSQTKLALYPGSQEWDMDKCLLMLKLDEYVNEVDRYYI